MDLNSIIKVQLEMDKKHGFPVDFENETSRYQQVTKDLVGLFGEIGEFSNIVKKINIKIDHPESYQFSIEDAEQNLREELIDSLIYIIRIGSILNIDLQDELLKKMAENSVRYKHVK